MEKTEKTGIYKLTWTKNLYAIMTPVYYPGEKSPAWRYMIKGVTREEAEKLLPGMPDYLEG